MQAKIILSVVLLAALCAIPAMAAPADEAPMQPDLAATASAEASAPEAAVEQPETTPEQSPSELGLFSDQVSWASCDWQSCVSACFDEFSDCMNGCFEEFAGDPPALTSCRRTCARDRTTCSQNCTPCPA